MLKSGLCTGHTSPGINEAVLHSMDFLSHFPYIGSLDFVLYFVSRPFWLCPVRSTLLQYVLDSSSTCRLTQIVLGTDSASICSYSSLYLASHALLHSLTHASSGLVYKEDILCCSVRNQAEGGAGVRRSTIGGRRSEVRGQAWGWSEDLAKLLATPRATRWCTLFAREGSVHI